MLHPLSDRVLIRRHDAAKKVGILFVPNQAKEKPFEGTVIAAGPGKILPSGGTRAMCLEPGMHVVFGKFVGDEIEVDGETMLMVRESDVLGWFDEK